MSKSPKKKQFNPGPGGGVRPVEKPNRHRAGGDTRKRGKGYTRSNKRTR